MPTVVTKTVRYTGGDYTTLAAALAAVPSNLVTADQQWDILIAESAAGNYEWNFGGYGPRTIGLGITADATRFIRIKPYPGLGFADRSYSGPTDYDPVKGIALKASNVVLGIRGNYVVIEGLQLKQTATSLNGGEYALAIEDAGGVNSTVKNCIISSNYTGDRPVVYWFGSTMINCLVIANDSPGVRLANTIANSTIINTGTVSTTTIGILSSPTTVKNTAIFGFSTATDSGSLVSGSNNNATNLSVVPTNWGSNSYSGLSTSTTFVDSIVSSTAKGNFRLRKSSPLVRGGARDATNTSDVDIVYRARSLTLPSIGAWEEPSASGTVFPSNIRFPIRDANGSATSTSVDMGDMFLRKEQYLTAGLWAWGANNNFGQLGINQSAVVSYSSPVQIGSLTSWRTVSSEGLHALAIKTDGTLWAWGYGDNGELGLANRVNYSSPVQVGSLTNWRQAVAVYLSSAAIKTDGTLWMWGYNGSGQLGNNTGLDYSSPVQVGALTDWRQVAVSEWFSTAAIKTDGTLWTWGANYTGQMGINAPTTLAYSSPVQVGALTNWKQVSCGYHMSAIKTDGTLWAWGYNFAGQLGNNTVVSYSSPVQVGTLNTWRQVACGYFHTMAIKNDGTLWAWGQNDEGQLGLGDTTNRSTPVQVGTLSNWKTVATSDYRGYTAAIKTDGTLWTWGYNGSGVLGTGAPTTVNYSSPVQVGALTTWKQISCGYAGQRMTAIQSPDLP